MIVMFVAAAAFLYRLNQQDWHGVDLRRRAARPPIPTPTPEPTPTPIPSDRASDEASGRASSSDESPPDIPPTAG
jgi:hypothetical protein